MERWMIEGGTPNTLLRRGLTKNSLPEGTEIIVDGYKAKNGSNRANGRDLTFTDGRKLFMGSSGTGAPRDGKDTDGEIERLAITALVFLSTAVVAQASTRRSRDVRAGGAGAAGAAVEPAESRCADARRRRSLGCGHRGSSGTIVTCAPASSEAMKTRS